ncbi:response regulator [Niabella pedocola]|uniref:Response regulator n=1 Tax=Niabella pedocola TaxID=1752077 RepID=A0ABS8PN38_9BACT|nr:response regulator [Niabella pedocola]MCD2422164.1 response regulator [Niabella pedocola]
MKHAKRILIIDDDSRNIFALQLTLKSRKYNYVSCQSAADGLKVLQTDPEIGLVLIDMMMPEMDGYETIRAIRSSGIYPAVPVIAVTANAMTGDEKKCLDAGADAYVAKPIDVDKLVYLIEKWL